jgi:hypothetical protein
MPYLTPTDAYNRVARAIRRGELVRPETCSRCGGRGKGPIEAHHEDHQKPLDVEWLCSSCHRYADAAKRWREDGGRFMARTSREARMRRMAKRQGLQLIKSRLRDPRAIGYGRWWVSDTNNILQSPEGGLTLDELEEYLDRPPHDPQRPEGTAP